MTIRVLDPQRAEALMTAMAIRDALQPWILVTSVVLVFAMTLMVVRLLRSRALVSDQGWAVIDIAWVLASFAAFAILSVSIVTDAQAAWYRAQRADYRAANRALQTDLHVFNRAYCLPTAGDNEITHFAARSDDRRTVCDVNYPDLNKAIGRNFDALWDEDDATFVLERYAPLDFPGMNEEEREARLAWGVIEGSAADVNFKGETLAQAAEAMPYVDVVGWIRRIWFIIFPIVAACRLMRSVNDLDRLRKTSGPA